MYKGKQMFRGRKGYRPGLVTVATVRVAKTTVRNFSLKMDHFQSKAVIVSVFNYLESQTVTVAVNYRYELNTDTY